MKSTITSKGQTTIPKSIRERLHLAQGAELDWSIEEGETVVVRLAKPSENPFMTFLGTFPLPIGQTTDEVMEQIRGERDPFLEGGPGSQVMSLHDFLTGLE